MTSQGSAHARFERFVRSGSVVHAETAARELGRLPLGEALALVLLYRQSDPAKYRRAVVRWHARFATETAGVSLPESQLVLVALGAFGEGSGEALALVIDVCRRHRVPGLRLAEQLAA